MRRRASLAVFAAVAIAGCGAGQSKEQTQQVQDSSVLLNNQPLPSYHYSQLRQNLIELENAEAQGVQTTSFFFNQGVTDPVQSCPSIGAPIPTTDQLSNPQQQQPDAFHSGSSSVVVGQMDPAGVYKGDSSGTYVICVGGNGKPYADYWEGFVQTVFGAATWDAKTHSVQLVGPPSFHFTGINGK